MGSPILTPRLPCPALVPRLQSCVKVAPPVTLTVGRAWPLISWRSISEDRRLSAICWTSVRRESASAIASSTVATGTTGSSASATEKSTVRGCPMSWASLMRAMRWSVTAPCSSISALWALISAVRRSMSVACWRTWIARIWASSAFCCSRTWRRTTRFRCAPRATKYACVTAEVMASRPVPSESSRPRSARRLLSSAARAVPPG